MFLDFFNPFLSLAITYILLFQNTITSKQIITMADQNKCVFKNTFPPTPGIFYNTLRGRGACVKFSSPDTKWQPVL